MVKAYVLIMNESGKEDYYFQSKKFSGITYAFRTYDIITRLESSNEENIQYYISNIIRKILNIRTPWPYW